MLMSLFILFFGFFGHHYNFGTLEEYHYYSPIWKHTIKPSNLSLEHHGVRIQWTRAQPQAYTACLYFCMAHFAPGSRG